MLKHKIDGSTTSKVSESHQSKKFLGFVPKRFVVETSLISLGVLVLALDSRLVARLAVRSRDQRAARS